MGMTFPFPFTLEMDNGAARIFCLGIAHKPKLRHIKFRQEWVKDTPQQGHNDPCTMS